MKKYILILVILTSSLSFASEYYAGGATYGSNPGLNVIAYSSDEEAIAANFSFALLDNFNEFTFTLDKLYYTYMSNDSSIFMGVGVKLSSEENKEIGVRGVMGISGYLVDIDENLEIFAEVDPTIHLAADTDFLDFEYAVGLRYYF
jgi:hypothetical protein